MQKYTHQRQVFANSSITCPKFHVVKVTHDYPLEDTRKSLLETCVCQMLAGFASDVFKYSQNPLSNDTGIHVTGTHIQAESELWKQLCSIRVTGSTFKDYSSNPEKMARALWQTKCDLSGITLRGI